MIYRNTIGQNLQVINEDQVTLSILTGEEKQKLVELGMERKFNEIAIYLGKKIYNICPFYTKAGYNDILIGIHDSNVKRAGYLGWNVFNQLPVSPLSLQERNKLIKDPKIKKKLVELFNLSHKFLIKPIMKIMFEKGANKDNITKDDFFQTKMNRYLNMDKLDPPKSSRSLI